jgi:hypothetical protein
MWSKNAATVTSSGGLSLGWGTPGGFLCYTSGLYQVNLFIRWAPTASNTITNGATLIYGTATTSGGIPATKYFVTVYSDNMVWSSCDNGTTTYAQRSVSYSTCVLLNQGQILYPGVYDAQYTITEIQFSGNLVSK